MCTVAVLMSTYNGERYLREQIDSILNQSGVHVGLYIRDDGSTDDTVAIIEDYCNRYSNIHYTQGVNVGVGNSFMQLVYDAPEYDYYAFSDQDDVWLPEKIIAAVNVLGLEKGPTLYCSNQILVDKDLIRIGMRYNQPPSVSYIQILCQNKISGCTMVWNKSLQVLLADVARRPEKTLLRNRIHDVWLAMVCSVVGKIVYDKDSYIYYRQHENNVVGVRKTSIIKQWIRKLTDPKQRNGRSSLAREVFEKYGDIIRSEDIKIQLSVYSNYKNRIQDKISLMKDKSLTRVTKENQLEFIAKVLLNLV